MVRLSGRRNATTRLVGAEEIWARRMTTEELSGPSASAENGQASTEDVEMDGFGHVMTHDADKLENDGTVRARYEDEEVDPMEESSD